MRATRFITAFLLACSAAFAQPESPAGPRPAFEVASVKTAVHLPPTAGAQRRSADGFSAGTGLGPCPTALKLDPAQVDIRCATLAMLIGYAYRFPPDRIEGPDWLQTPMSPRFDIVAKLPAGAARAEIPEMLQSLLADRFHLALHRAPATKPVLALALANGGLKMKPAAPAAEPVPTDTPDAAPPTLGFFGSTQDQTSPNPSGPGTITVITGPRIGTVRQFDAADLKQRWESPAISLPGLADLLDKIAPLPLPIVDQTGVAGQYRLLLEMSMADYLHPGAVDPNEAADTVLRVFNDSLRKLGLQLQRRTAPLPTLFIDRLDSAPTAN